MNCQSTGPACLFNNRPRAGAAEQTSRLGAVSPLEKINVRGSQSDYVYIILGIAGEHFPQLWGLKNIN